MIPVLVGLDFHRSPVDVRERLVAAAANMPSVLHSLVDSTIGELTVLSTCNRFEVYTSCLDTEAGAAAVVDYLCMADPPSARTVAAHLYTKVGHAAVDHLFRVACGLESLVLGETQIMRQVADAYDQARAADVSGPVLARLFASALHTGKRARHETAISQHTLSVSHAAVLLAKQHHGVATPMYAAVLGAGEMAQLAGEALRQHDVHHVTVVNRTAVRGTDLAKRLGAQARPWSELSAAIAEADVIIAATGAGRPILDVPFMERVLLERAARPLLLLDIGVPRNIEPGVAALSGVTVRDIDDLQSVVADHRQLRAAESANVEAIIAEELSDFVIWIGARRAVPVIRQLRAKAAEIAQAEIARMHHKLPDLSDHQRAVVEEMAQRIVNKLLHDPTIALKGRAAQGDHFDYAHATRKLFGLDEPLLERPQRDDRA